MGGHIHNQGTQKDCLTKKDYKGLFWIFIIFISYNYIGLLYAYD